MINRILRFFGIGKPKLEWDGTRWRRECLHPNLQSRKWLSDDRTPMMYCYCPNCGFKDTGHVHADPETWINNGIQK